jgi:hypothetical protein
MRRGVAVFSDCAARDLDADLLQRSTMADRRADSRGLRPHHLQDGVFNGLVGDILAVFRLNPGVKKYFISNSRAVFACICWIWRG